MNQYSLFGMALILLVAQRGNAEDPKEIASFKHDLRLGAVAFSPDGKILATANYDMTLKLWDTSFLLKREVVPLD